MPEPLSLLVLSNPEDDFSALLEALAGGGFLLRVRHVHSVDEFARSLDAVPCDVALVSDQLASGSGLDGLPFVDARGLDMPFIVVSSNSDPIWMASVMRAGAHDVVSRDRLWRLAPAIEREHRQAQLRSQRVQAEVQLRARARQQEVVAELGLRALSEKDLSDLLDQGLRAVADTLDLRLVALFEPVPGRAEVSLKSGVAWVAGSVGRTFELGGPAESVAPEAHAVVDYLLAHPAECPAVLGEYGVVSGLSVVVRGAHAPVGVLGAYTSVPRIFTRDDVNFLQAVANVIAGAIMRWTAEEDQLKSHQRLLSVQRMEAIGRLAGGIAHDFNNLVQAIGGYSEVMLQRLPEGDVLRSHAEEIKKAGDRAAALTRQLLAFSRQQVLQPKVIDLNTVVFNMEELLRRLIGEHIELKARPAADLWTLKADVAQIEQVLMNLAVNSRDAMPEGGTLSITTTNVGLPQPGQHESFPVTPGPYVELVVEDSGCGMSPEIRARAFEPFFTTKEPGKGTGLGLSTVYGIVKQSGGYIWVDSEVGHGTRIRICLPRAGEVAPPVEVRRAPSTQVPRGSETLLLVEDEEGVRELMRDYLSAHGYQVLVATNGSEAMARCEEFEGRIEVLIADVVMPQMGGPALTKKLLPLRPDMKIVYVSGYADEALGDHRVLESGAAFLQKPFSLESLVRKVREILDVPTPTV
jgi:signal transduction histidine kinase/DNA-binding response OmpR family regulator